MKKTKYTEEQIIGILKEADAGISVAELCRKYGFSDATYYNWKAKYGGMTVSDAKRLKALEERLREERLRVRLNYRLFDAQNDSSFNAVFRNGKTVVFLIHISYDCREVFLGIGKRDCSGHNAPPR